jgi:hypothetical protein
VKQFVITPPQLRHWFPDGKKPLWQELHVCEVQAVQKMGQTLQPEALRKNPGAQRVQFVAEEQLLQLEGQGEHRSNGFTKFPALQVVQEVEDWQTRHMLMLQTG